jgi:hypothetical protein
MISEIIAALWKLYNNTDFRLLCSMAIMSVVLTYPRFRDEAKRARSEKNRENL